MEGERNWADYGRGLCIAEEAVGATIDQRHAVNGSMCVKALLLYNCM